MLPIKLQGVDARSNFRPSKKFAKPVKFPNARGLTGRFACLVRMGGEGARGVFLY